MKLLRSDDEQSPETSENEQPQRAPLRFVPLGWICPDCGADINPTGERDGLYEFCQCDTGHMFVNPRKRYVRPPTLKGRPSGYTPNDAA